MERAQRADAGVGGGEGEVQGGGVVDEGERMRLRWPRSQEQRESLRAAPPQTQQGVASDEEESTQRSQATASFG